MANDTYRSLEYYTTFSERLILSYNKKYNRNYDPSDDMIGYVANRLMKAESRYRYDKVTEKCRLNRTEEDCRKYFLRMHGIYGIKAYADNIYKKRKKRARHVLATDLENADLNFLSEIYVDKNQKSVYNDYSTDETRKEQRRLIDILINSSDLTDKQKHAVRRHIFDKKTFDQIAAENNPPITPQAVSYAYQTALNKMRSVVKNKV